MLRTPDFDIMEGRIVIAGQLCLNIHLDTIKQSLLLRKTHTNLLYSP